MPLALYSTRMDIRFICKLISNNLSTWTRKKGEDFCLPRPLSCEDADKKTLVKWRQVKTFRTEQDCEKICGQSNHPWTPKDYKIKFFLNVVLTKLIFQSFHNIKSKLKNATTWTSLSEKRRKILWNYKHYLHEIDICARNSLRQILPIF